MTVLQLFQYFKNIAINQKQIAHTDNNPKFAHIDFESQNSIRTTLDTTTPVLLLDTPNGTLQGKNANAILDYFITRFAVVKNVRKDDFLAERETYSQTLEIGKEIIRYIINDQMQPCELDWLSPNISYQPVYMLDNAIGYLFTIQYYSEFDRNPDPDKWFT